MIILKNKHMQAGKNTMTKKKRFYKNTSYPYIYSFRILHNQVIKNK